MYIKYRQAYSATILLSGSLHSSTHETNLFFWSASEGVHLFISVSFNHWQYSVTSSQNMFSSGGVNFLFAIIPLLVECLLLTMCLTIFYKRNFGWFETPILATYGAAAVSMKRGVSALVVLSLILFWKMTRPHLDYAGRCVSVHKSISIKAVLIRYILVLDFLVSCRSYDKYLVQMKTILCGLVQVIRHPVSLKDFLQIARIMLGPMYILNYALLAYKEYIKVPSPTDPLPSAFRGISIAMVIVGSILCFAAGTVFRPDNEFFSNIAGGSPDAKLRKKGHRFCMILSFMFLIIADSFETLSLPSFA